MRGTVMVWPRCNCYLIDTCMHCYVQERRSASAEEFAGVQRVAFDPDEAGRIYVTTFGGGIWRNGDSRQDAQQQQQQPE